MPREITGQWSYSGNPKGNEVDAVRFLIGDTNPKDKQISNCEIEFQLDEQGSVLEAAICCVQGLIALYARDFDDNLKTKSAQVTANYREMLKTLEEKRNSNLDPIYVGGISESDKAINEADEDRVKPMFTRHTGDNYRDQIEYI